MRVDLHIHSTASDGALPPEAVVRRASAGGLDVIAVSDHDTTAGCAAAAAVGRAVDVQVVPAVEVSATYQARDVHILGYFLDPDAGPIVRHAARAASRRESRMGEMIDRLGGAGFVVSYEDVVAAAGPGAVILGRPHLAAALVRAGHVYSVQEAFDRLIGDESEAFVPTLLVDPATAIDIVVRSGGIPVWAHPPQELVDSLLPSLVDAGLRGLEVYRPRHRRNDVLRLEAICRARGLMMSGGSDWHGPDQGGELGAFWVEGAEIEALLDAGGL